MRHDVDIATTQDPTMAETVAEIEASRQRLSSSLGALKQEINELADWRSWVRRHPWHFVGGAAALGFWLGCRR